MTTNVAVLTALLAELQVTERQSFDALAALQHQRLELLTGHLERHSGQFRSRLRAAGVTRGGLLAPGGLSRLPVLTRRDLQNAADLYCDTVPAGHEPTYETQTSGSTGEPVVVRRTMRNAMDWMAASIREHLWHRRDFSMPFCSIRAHFNEPVLCQDWGPPANWLFQTGPLLGIPVTTDIDRQIELIRDFKPHILLIYPSNLAALINRGTDLPSVRQIVTTGETLSPQTRSDAGRLFGAVADIYSSQEMGSIAIQCPDSTLYHVMGENLILEVLNGDGTACREGETGRVVATDLRNFATPLVRYDLGDLAEVGPPCACGRTLPTLSRIVGRERNLVLMPDGTRHWPLVGFSHFRAIAPVMQYQFIQHGRHSIEFRLVTQRPLSTGEETALAACVQKSLGFSFAVQFTYFEERIPSGANGKFEEFICRIAA
jgi:phenylacetate-CoA ligase